MNLPATTEALLQKAHHQQLLSALITQLNKDFQRAGLDVSFHENLSPSELAQSLHEVLGDLITRDFGAVLPLLYLADVPESSVRAWTNQIPEDPVTGLTLLLLKREWQKVSYRSLGT